MTTPGGEEKNEAMELDITSPRIGADPLACAHPVMVARLTSDGRRRRHFLCH